MDNKKGLNVSTKAYLDSLLVIFIFMVASYAFTFIVPSGQYTRVTDSYGNMVISQESSFTFTDASLPFWKWILSPFLVLGAEGSGTLLAIIAFLLVVGGIFNCLDKHGLMQYMLKRIVSKYENRRYTLMAVMVFFFMALGAVVGSFEEVVPLVPIVVQLACGLGWDTITGIGMSMLAVGCGFASGVLNPFTVGVAQKLAGIPMFSGLWLRCLAFILIYALLILILRTYAKKIEKPVELIDFSQTQDKAMDKGLMSFGIILGIGILAIISSVFIQALQDYTIIIVAIMFLAAGIVSCAVSGMKGKTMAKEFKNGLVSILPAVLMILMASSIKYTLTEAQVLDSIMHDAVRVAQKLPKPAVILFVYLIVLVMNFFIASGSAKAFLLIPLIVPIAQIFGISAQLCVVAFAFGDGFSNVFYPTNPALLISLGLVDVSYSKWAKWSWKFQLLNLLLTSLILLLGLAVGY